MLAVLRKVAERGISTMRLSYRMVYPREIPNPGRTFLWAFLFAMTSNSIH